MRVESEEVSAVQAAARMINEELQELKTLYSRQDDLSIAIMCCLKIATEHAKQIESNEKLSVEMQESLDKIEQQLDKTLST